MSTTNNGTKPTTFFGIAQIAIEHARSAKSMHEKSGKAVMSFATDILVHVAPNITSDTERNTIRDSFEEVVCIHFGQDTRRVRNFRESTRGRQFMELYDSTLPSHFAATTRGTNEEHRATMI